MSTPTSILPSSRGRMILGNFVFGELHNGYNMSVGSMSLRIRRVVLKDGSEEWL
jgi:hypothetical protein